MQLHITAKLFAMATGKDYQTASKRLRALPHVKGPAGEHFFLLTRAITQLRLTEDNAIPILFHSATPLEAPLPNDAPQIAANIDKWLHQKTRDHSRQAMVARLAATQKAFAQHVADATESSALARHTEDLRNLLMLDSEIGRYVTTGDQTAFPADFRRWAIGFAITHMQPRNNALAA